jgi:ABC-type amino acid transport/signal transduction systems, periplasmic component/domain
MNFRLRIFVFFAACGLLAGCASAPQTQAVPASSTVLRVGVAPNSPPMIFKSNDGLVGVEKELAESLGQELGRKVVFVEEKWENLIDALCDNRIDIIMSSMSITAARSYRIAFSDPYLKVGQMVLARADEKYKYLGNLTDLASRGVGLKPGTTGDFLVRQEFPGVSRKYFENGEEAAEALVRKKIDLFINDAPMIWYLAGRYEAKGLAVTPIVLSEEQLGWGLRRTDTELRTSVNAFLKKSQANGSLNRTFSKWMPGFQ